jgi:lysylphosphatidylglycerol synthetase-like protein (DUF2156 family)
VSDAAGTSAINVLVLLLLVAGWFLVWLAHRDVTTNADEHAVNLLLLLQHTGCRCKMAKHRLRQCR